MKKCGICGNPTNLFTRKQITDGYVCKNCKKIIPVVMQNQLNDFDINYLGIMMRKFKKNHDKYVAKYEETARYGRLSVDEYHGLFAIVDKKKVKNSKLPSDCYDVFVRGNGGRYWIQT